MSKLKKGDWVNAYINEPAYYPDTFTRVTGIIEKIEQRIVFIRYERIGKTIYKTHYMQCRKLRNQNQSIPYSCIVRIWNTDKQKWVEEN